MPSTYSSLKIELMAQGENNNQWGNITNANLGTAMEQAIVGMGTVSSGFTANVATLTLANTNALQNARALVLNVTATLSGAGTLNVPAIQKPYLVFNNTSGGFALTVKVAGQTGISVPNGRKALVYNNGTDVGEAINYLSTLTLGSALPAASGGTGVATSGGTAGLALLSDGAGGWTVGAVSNLPRVVVIADGTSITMNADTTDMATQANTQTAGTLTVNAPSGTPTNGQKIMLRLRSTNVQTFAWNAIFQGGLSPLPTASSGSSKYDYYGFIYNGTATKWQIVGTATGF
jgi:hypothetical protein